MSLYTEEEVCVGCIRAVFHTCCDKFCHCIINADIDTQRGTCEDKEEYGNEVSPKTTDW